MKWIFSTGENNFLEIPDGCMLSSYYMVLKNLKKSIIILRRASVDREPAFSVHANTVT